MIIKVSTFEKKFGCITNCVYLSFEYMSDMRIKNETFFTDSQVDDTSRDREECITSEEVIYIYMLTIKPNRIL